MRLPIPLLGLLLAFLAGAAPALADCPLDLGRGTGWVVYSDHYMIAFRPDPMRIELGEPFALLFNVCTKNGNPAELVAVEALMPDQKEIMKGKPTIVSAGDGRYRAEGMVFHRSGRWEIAIDVRAGEESERLTHEIILK
jgi:hypothetical protein